MNVVRDPIFVSDNCRRPDAKHGWVTGDPMGPLSTAVILAGTVRVNLTEFRSLDANCGLVRPLVNRDSQVWELLGRKSASEERVPRMKIGRQAGRRSPG